MEKDLAKKKPTAARQRSSRKSAPGTVSSLKPTAPMTVPTDMTVHEAAQLMAAKREDCVLVISPESHLAGIFTAKDLAFRVVSQNKNPASTLVSEIMTPNPMCTRIDTSATEALDLMVTKGFRHLPVVDEDGDVSGVLDITKCFYEAMEKLERAYSSSKKLYDALEGVHSEMGASHQPAPIIEYVETLRKKMSGPQLESILDGTAPTWVTVKTSVREATTLMRENHTTAVLVMDGQNLAGIFTSKDVVLRVIAPGLDSGVCSVVRVMTPHPDCAASTLSIQDGLRKMNDGHYLNLPVTDEEDNIIGMVDVLKLTYATLEQVHSMNTSGEEGPMWNKFWTSVGDDNEGSVVSASDTPSRQSHRAESHSSRAIDPFSSDISPLPITHEVHEYDSPVKPGDSISAHREDEPAVPDADAPFVFKFKAPSGKVHRLTLAPSAGLAAFRSLLTDKLGAEVSEVTEDFGVSYVDDDGDVVSITTDEDLAESVSLAMRTKKDKVDLYVHHPEGAAVPVVKPAPAHSPFIEKLEDATADVKEKIADRVQAATGKEPMVPGVSNDLLIPGALVALAVVIVGVFAISRK
ncbi:CBS and PB1 domain protein [Taphrina deformans PYCC 5710]|uniref:CBS and PB1 domain protein n=1 Tax=Taphrina deformans (strain PYCC 5710 / ATCC 11124 / CBS 356.35 / IMI 108563 / JCM 9778 / NBRC 8474) TaxID=1097556 RepID=R4XIT8_TAPDE|nr:CBS and PB1 domain protein [Taphrina deformans PYCC 5710]|eukprot:CCG83283.1 CBS and PB1 domain protein [Taphrina deformans PYCC 5710]